MTRGSSCGHRTAIAGSPFDDLRIFSATFRTVAPRSPRDNRTVSHGAPPDEEKWGGIGRTSGGHRANFNCEFNLPDHRWMSAGWVLNRRITAGFLQDSSHGSPCGGVPKYYMICMQPASFDILVREREREQSAHLWE